MTFLELAEEVLKNNKIKLPLTYKQIWKNAESQKFVQKLGSKGQTPEHTLRVSISGDIREKKENSKFKKLDTKPTTFWLKERENELPPLEILKQKIQEAQEQEIEKKDKFEERDLHPLLINFLINEDNNDDNFNIRAKTLYHEKCIKSKKGKGIWNYPDIVGVSFPFDNEEMKEETLNLLQNINQIKYKLYSFELKIRVNFSNLKECYFQAVSNSSWANEGYLVVFDIDEEIIDELKRLNASFGIGVIQLDIENLKPKVILPSSQRELDIETLNMLVKDSPDFKDFIEDINRHIKAKAGKLGNIADRFDKVFNREELEKYIKEKHIVKEN